MIKPEQRRKIITMLAEGHPDEHIRQAIHLSVDTIHAIGVEYSSDISEIKKAINSKMVESAADQLSKIAADALLISGEVLKHLKDTFKAASPAQAAVIFGILQDKYNNILGNPSQVVRVQFQSRGDMLGFIKEGATLPPLPAAQPIIEVEALPHIPPAPKSRHGRTGKCPPQK